MSLIDTFIETCSLVTHGGTNHMNEGDLNKQCGEDLLTLPFYIGTMALVDAAFHLTLKLPSLCSEQIQNLCCSGDALLYHESFRQRQRKLRFRSM